MQKLPIGIQDFRKLRKGGYLYVDKTKVIHQLISTGQYYFFSRPRRFGKSLLISTLRELFLGHRQLFEGLWIEDRYEWEPGPVIHIAFNDLGYKDNGLEEAIQKRLREIAEDYGISLSSSGVALSFRELIRTLADGGKVALLIDEYDKPIIDYLDDLPQARENREILKSFYSIIKEADPLLRFAFLTGVSKFSKVSIFSDLNNLEDITISQQFNNLAGYTQQELEENFADRIDDLSRKSGEDREALLARIRDWYNGYNWTGTERLYNPFSILNFFKRGQFQNFWFATGTPTFLIKSLREGWHYQLDKLDAGSVLLDSLPLENPDYRSLLFQTGYLTILDQPLPELFVLGYPNREVKASLLQYLVGSFAHRQQVESLPTVLRWRQALEEGDLEQFFHLVENLFGNIPERIFREKTEAAYHSVIYTALSLMGIYIRCEVGMGDGYIDAVVETSSRVYLMEFKVGYTPEDALEQVRRRRYSKAYEGDDREVLAVGVSFSTTYKGVADWEVQQVT